MYRESDIEYKFWILLAGLFRHFFFYDTKELRCQKKEIFLLERKINNKKKKKNDFYNEKQSDSFRKECFF